MDVGVLASPSSVEAGTSAGAPQHLRRDNGPEFVAEGIQRWFKRSGVNTLYINKGSPWENGYVESFNGKLWDELLNRELFLSLAEAWYVLDQWRLDYNHHRPHSVLGWQTPAAFAANVKAQEDRSDGVFPSAMLADLPDQPAQSPPILSQGLDQET